MPIFRKIPLASCVKDHVDAGGDWAAYKRAGNGSRLILGHFVLAAVHDANKPEKRPRHYLFWINMNCRSYKFGVSNAGAMRATYFPQPKTPEKPGSIWVAAKENRRIGPETGEDGPIGYLSDGDGIVRTFVDLTLESTDDRTVISPLTLNCGGTWGRGHCPCGCSGSFLP